MTDHIKLKVPTVHMNGTSKGELLNQLSSVLQEIREVEDALRKASPHGRDYYVQNSPGERPAINIAIEQHVARLTKLDEIAKEIEYIAVKVVEQGKTTK